MHILDFEPPLVSHYSAIGDAISCDAPYNAIGFRGKTGVLLHLSSDGGGYFGRVTKGPPQSQPNILNFMLEIWCQILALYDALSAGRLSSDTTNLLTTSASKKDSEKPLGRVLGKGSQKGFLGKKG